MIETDLISRQAAIDAIDSAAENWNISEPYHEGVRVGYKNSARLILSLPSAQPEPSQVARDIVTIIENEQDMRVIERNAQQWIPCSERLPDAQTEVIVSCMDDSGDTRFLYTSSGWVTTNGEYWIVDNEINSFVIAWMPLPDPYKEEKL